MLLDSTHIRSASYVPDSIVVTTGQPVADKPDIKVAGGSAAIVINAGRKKSSTVADKFAKVSGGNMYAPFGGQGGAEMPAEVREAYRDRANAVVAAFDSGTLTLRGSLEDPVDMIMRLLARSNRINEIVAEEHLPRRDGILS